MANASSSRVSTRFIKEVTYGTTPSTPTLSTIRRVPGGGGLQRNSQVVSSQEADSSRTIPDQIETGYSAAFDYNWELQSGDHDPFFKAILGGTPVTVSMSAATIAAVASGNKLTDSGSGFVAAGLRPGMWINVAGFTGGSTTANTFMRISDADGDVAVGQINIDPATVTLINDAAGETVTIKTVSVRTGTNTADSFSFESNFTDLSNVYLQGVGFRPTRMQINVTAGAVVTGSTNFLGKSVDTSSSAFASESVSAAGTTPSMNATSNVPSLYEGGAVIATLARQATININPNVTELRAISNIAAAGLIDGTFDITVALNLFFSDLSMMTKVTHRTSTSLCFPFRDANGKTIIFTLPKVYLAGTPKEQGQNQPVAQDLTATAVRYTGWSATPSVMMQIDMLT